MNTSEVLHKAADELQENGWLSLKWPVLVLKPAPTCAQVAISRVAEAAGADRWVVLEAFYGYLGGNRIRDIWHWNDAEGRTAEQVIEALRAAAIIEAAKEVDVRVVVSA